MPDEKLQFPSKINKKSENYQEFISTMLDYFTLILKVQMLHAYFNEIPALT